MAYTINPETMEFKDNVLVDRELEIATYLQHELSLNSIVQKTGLNRKIVHGHVRNMREKLNIESNALLIKIIQSPPILTSEKLESGNLEVIRSRIREATDCYFDSVRSRNDNSARRNMILISAALLLGITSVVFACQNLITIFLSSDLIQDLQKLFAN